MPPDHTEATIPATRPRGARQRALAGMIASPDLAGAAGWAIRLEGDGAVPDAERRAYRELRRRALGDEALAGHWGDDAVLDALRARILRARSGGVESVTRAVRWEGFLGWAGARLATGLLASAPRSTLAACAASLAAFGGAAFALDALGAPAGSPDEKGFAVLSLLGLRSALDGTFTPPAVPWLVPSTASLQRASPRGRSPWACALLAARGLGRAGTSPGLVHLTAALAATWFRERFRAVAREGGVAIPARPWGAPSLDAADQDAVWLAMGLIRRDPPAFRRADRPAWPKGWGGPDLRRLEERLAALAGCGVPSASEVFLDDDLATATIHCLAGDVPRASALLASTRTPTILQGARAVLERALARAAGGEPLPELPVSREADSLLQKLLHFPDPSVALRTPHALLQDGRGALVSRLVGEGRAAAARAVRTLLDRRDLAAALSPYWLLDASEESQAGVARLARWLSARVAMPGEDACLAWIAGRWPSLVEAVR